MLIKDFMHLVSPLHLPPQRGKGEIINTILSNPLKLKAKTQTVYVYDSNTMELINNKPFNSIKELCSLFKIAKHIVQYYIDTEKPILLNGKFC
jgi:NUMOD1 domain